MRHQRVLAARSLLMGTLAACSSSSDAVGVPAADASAISDGSPDATLPTGDAASTGDDAPESTPDASAPIADAQADAGSSVADVDASTACVKYCACMAMNCADKVFANGCLYACATQTDWDLSCRANMCNLVQAQPNNDHCTHAFGVNECLDQ